MKNKDLKVGDKLYVIDGLEIKHVPIYSLEKKPDSRFISVIMDYEADVGSLFFDSEDSRDFVISKCCSASNNIKEVKKELSLRVTKEVGRTLSSIEHKTNEVRKLQELLEQVLKDV